MRDLDVLTRKWTAFPTFAHLLAGGASTAEQGPEESSYFPSMHPNPYDSTEEIAGLVYLADQYDQAQQARGDRRRVCRGSAEWWQSSSKSPRPGRKPRRSALRKALQGRRLADGRALFQWTKPRRSKG